MAEFLYSDSFRRFEWAVERETRYVHNNDVKDFLAAVIESSEKRKDSVDEGSILWRAQRGFTWRTENEGTDEAFDVPDAFEAERMVPKAEFVSDGRVNPRGIPCLYLATTQEAAVAEVRPWVGSYISMAQFKVMRDVTVVDCTKDKRLFPNWLLKKDPHDMPAEKREQIAWGEIGHAFSRPVTPDEPGTEYVPTQVLAEAFRAHGLGGIVYRSLLGEGFNVALFDCTAAELINCGLYDTTGVKFKFEQCSNPYFIRKHYEQLQEKPETEKQESGPTSSS